MLLPSERTDQQMYKYALCANPWQQVRLVSVHHHLRTGPGVQPVIKTALKLALNLLGKCGKFVVFFKSLHSENETLMSIHLTPNKPVHKHIQQTDIRWNSINAMITILLYQKAVFGAALLAADSKIEMDTSAEPSTHQEVPIMLKCLNQELFSDMCACLSKLIRLQ